MSSFEDKKSWLFRYYNCRQEQKRLEEQLEIAMASACRITPTLTGMPGGGGVSDKVGAAVENIDNIKFKLECARNAGYVYLNELISALSDLPEHKHEALRVRFMYGTRWQDIARCQGYDERTVKGYYKEFMEAFEIPEQEPLNAL